MTTTEAARTPSGVRHPTLDLTVPVLTRPCGQVQIGWSPGTAVVVESAHGTNHVATLLAALDGVRPLADLLPLATRAGLDRVQLDALLSELARRRLLRWTAPPGTGRACLVVLHGRGPLADQLGDGLRAAGIRVHASTGRHLNLAPRGQECEVVLLSDALVPDPQLLAELVSEGRPHLPVRLRDGTALVGPLVLPGRTSCVRCADLYRTDADPEWPVVAAQLLHRTSGGSTASVRAAAALALAQVEHMIRGGADGEGPPASLGATLELNLTDATLVRRAWPAHRRCGCGAHP